MINRCTPLQLQTKPLLLYSVCYRAFILVKMEIKDIHEHAGWFASYMNAHDGGNDAQGEALVKCQIKKIKQLTELIENIKG